MSIETETSLEVNEDVEGKPAIVEQTEIQIEAPGTSVTESVQDVVLGGGEHIVKDVALTIHQVIEPVEKGVTKIQETFHLSTGSDKEEEGSKVEINELVKENVERGEVSVVRRAKVITESND